MYAPWLVPIAIAKLSTPVSVANFNASSGFVYIACSSDTLTSSSTPANVPISASTVTFLKCAYSTTFLVSATFSSYGLLDISIITDVYPASIHSLAISKLAP